MTTLASLPLSRVYLTGGFPGIRVIDVSTCIEIDKIPTRRDRYCLCSVDSGNPDSPLLAVSGGSQQGSNSFAMLYDQISKERLSQIVCLGAYMGLESCSSVSLSSSPVLLMGAHRHLYCCDALTGETLLECQDGPRDTYAISCFENWSPSEVFVAGRFDDTRGFLARYDLCRGLVPQGSYVEFSTPIIRVGTGQETVPVQRSR